MRYFGLLLLLLTGCATTGNYEQSLQKWVGASQSELYNYWGVPNSQFYVTPNTQVVTYVKTDKGPIDGNTQPYAGIEVAYPAIETPDYGENLSNYNSNNPVYFCKTSFTITNNQVVDYTFNGDDCVVSENIF